MSTVDHAEQVVIGGTPVVLVHGNPETAAVWDLLLAELG